MVFINNGTIHTLAVENYCTDDVGIVRSVHCEVVVLRI